MLESAVVVGGCSTVLVCAVDCAGAAAMEDDDEGWTVVKRHRRT